MGNHKMQNQYNHQKQRIVRSVSRKPYSVKLLYAIYLSAVLLLSTVIGAIKVSAASSSSFLPFIILNQYSKTMAVGDEYPLIAVTSTGAFPGFKSSNSKVASVNTYGVITAKKPGTAKITVKISKAEAVCRIQVKKTTLKLSKKSCSLENGKKVKLTATASTKGEIIWKSSKSSVAKVDEKGVVTACKTGTADITAKVDGSSAVCKITVRKPAIKLAKTKATLYRGQKLALNPKISSQRQAVFKSSKKSVATVSEAGVITAVKHGTAEITASLDGTVKTCKITVKSPTIKTESKKISMKEGETRKLQVTVSSGNKPSFTSSKSNVAEIDSDGVITAHQKGTAVITISEDGTRIKVNLEVTE